MVAGAVLVGAGAAVVEGAAVSGTEASTTGAVDVDEPKPPSGTSGR